MDLRTVENYVKAGKALQEKYDEIRRGIFIHRKELEDQYEPIIQPLSEINAELKKKRRSFVPPRLIDIENEPPRKKIKTEEEEELVNKLGVLPFEYLVNTPPSARDTTFGIRSVNQIPYIGDSPIDIKNNILTVKNDKFVGTPGLWELLVLKEPKNHTKDDLNNYANILMSTSAHRVGNDPNKPVKSSNGKKYTKIIKPILIRYNQAPSLYDEMASASYEGSGLHLRKLLTRNAPEYVYWNSLEELLERLCIVYGEIKAGNTNKNLVNEIINIVQEIREIK